MKKKGESASARSVNIPSFKVMDVLEKAQAMERQGRKVVHLEIGEPGFDTPDVVVEAGIKAMKAGKTKYTHSLGLSELRSAISSSMKSDYGVVTPEERILVTAGTSNGLFLLLAALIEKGDEVIMADPCYSCYPNFVSFLGGKPVFVKTRESERFQMLPEAVRKKVRKRTRAILINSPCNPTGMIMPPEIMKEIAGIGPVVISDEIYHGLVYEGRASSILEHTGNAFVINGFSKKYAMTGWRLGYIIAPEEYLRPMQKVQQNISISVNSFVQWGGIAALRKGAPFVRKTAKVYNERRLYMLKRLEEIGLPVSHPPEGAYYFFTNASRYGKDSLKLCDSILDEAGVAVTPGMDFGAAGEGYIRLSYANSMDNIKTGLNRLGRYLEKRR